MASVKFLCSVMLIVAMVLPVQNQSMGEKREGVNWAQLYNGFFANPVIQTRQFLAIFVNWIGKLVTWIILGSAWSNVRGDQYDHNLNTTWLFNWAMSDTKGSQNTIKSLSYGVFIALIWQALISFGAPVPYQANIENRRVGRKYNRGSRNWESDEEDNFETNFSKLGISYFPPHSESVLPILENPHKSPSFWEDVMVPALNSNLEPNGLGRQVIIHTVVALAKTLFWIICTLLLPQIDFDNLL